MLRFAEKLSDPLYKNSFFIMLSSITNAGFGFLPNGSSKTLLC